MSAMRLWYHGKEHASDSNQESAMKNINEIIADVAEPPKTFEGYLMAYADQVGDLVNTYLPAERTPTWIVTCTRR